MPAKIRPNVLQMTPYSPGKPIEEVRRELGLEKIIKLASNENPLGPSPKAVAAVQEAAKSMNLYPDASGHNLKAAIGAKFGVPMDQILIGNGSDELIHLLGLVLLGGEADEVIVGLPSFVRYDAAAHLAPCKLVQVPLDADYRHDLPAMARAVTENTKMMFIANPNNPTGTVVSRAEVDALLADLPGHVTLILDEAYFEFASHLPDYPLSTDYLAKGHNVVGLRTFSKTYGLAGIRIGYGFAPAGIVDAIDRAREPFNTNSLAQAAAIGALSDDEHIARTVENNRAGLARLTAIFEKASAKVCPSFANFVFADLGRPAKPVADALLQRGIIVRPGAGLGAPNVIRVSVGTDAEIDAFEAAFFAVVSS